MWRLIIIAVLLGGAGARASITTSPSGGGSVNSTNANFATTAGTAGTTTNLAGDILVWSGGVGTDATTLQTGKSAATAGNTIEVAPKDVGATNLLKNGVDWWFKNVTLTHSNQIPQADGLPVGQFDDRNQGAMTNTIRGIKNVTWFGQNGMAIGGTSQTNPFVNARSFGPIVTTNSATRLTFEADSILATALGDINISSALTIYDTALSVYKINTEITDPYITNQFLGGLDEFDEPVYMLSVLAGIYWEHGETHVTVPRIVTPSYVYYGNDTGAKTTVENFWLTADYCKSTRAAGCYVVGASTRWRNWLQIKELESDFGDAITLFGTQRFYLFGNAKLASNASGGSGIFLGSSGSPEAWITTQKTVTTNGYFSYIANTGFVDFTCQQYEDTGTSGAAIGFRTTSGTNIIHGGRAKITNGKGISHAGGRTFAENLFLDTATTTNVANNPVSVSAAGLILKDCTLIAPVGAQCVTASSPQTVTVIGTLTCNYTNSPNITFVGGTVITNLSLPRL